MRRPTLDEVLAVVIDTPDERRGFDDARSWYGRPGEWRAGTRPDDLAKMYLLTLDQYAGYAATLNWSFWYARSRREFRGVVEELERGVATLRDLLDDLPEGD